MTFELLLSKEREKSGGLLSRLQPVRDLNLRGLQGDVDVDCTVANVLKGESQLTRVGILGTKSLHSPSIENVNRSALEATDTLCYILTCLLSIKELLYTFVFAFDSLPY